jgi:hypothetical protein
MMGILDQYKGMRQKLAAAVKDQVEAKPEYARDSRFWRPTKRPDFKSKTLVRFIPGPIDFNTGVEPKFFIRYNTHMLNDKYFACPGRECPICKHGWDIYRETKVKPDYVANRTTTTNIYIIKDALAPENNGKIFLYNLPQAIMGKINNAISSDDEFTSSFDPYDLLGGKDFLIETQDKGGYFNYDLSNWFGECKPVGNDELVEKLLTSSYNLDALVDGLYKPSQDELLSHLNSIINLSDVVTQKREAPHAEKPKKTEKPKVNDDPFANSLPVEPLKIEGDLDDDFFND